MRTSTNQPDPSTKGSNMQHEADVGSGERSPGQQETDDMIKQIPSRGNRQDAGRPGSQQSGKDNAAKP